MERDIRTRREALGLSQRQLASLAGVSNSSLSRIEAGTHTGSAGVRKLILDALAAGEDADKDSPVREAARMAARAGYRLGMLEAMLHPDTIKALEPPGILIENMKGEHTWRLMELAACELVPEDIADLRLWDPMTGEGADLPKPVKRRRKKTTPKAVA